MVVVEMAAGKAEGDPLAPAARFHGAIEARLWRMEQVGLVASHLVLEQLLVLVQDRRQHRRQRRSERSRKKAVNSASETFLAEVCVFFVTSEVRMAVGWSRTRVGSRR